MALGTNRLRRSAFLNLRDFGFGAAVFWGLTVALCGLHGKAHALNLPQQTATAVEMGSRVGTAEKVSGTYRSYAGAAERPVPQISAASARPTLLILGFVFALLTMMNLAFVRHIRRTYARPRALRPSRKAHQ